jgi:hypothetical protein
MLPRLDVLWVGPLTETFANTPVALEEYAMRLDSKLPAAQLVDLPFAASPAAVEEPERVRRRGRRPRRALVAGAVAGPGGRAVAVRRPRRRCPKPRGPGARRASRCA